MTEAQRVKEARLEAEEDVRTVMSTERGRRFLWRMLDVSGVFESSFTGDALSTAFSEGRRSVGVKLMDELQRLARDSYAEMVVEALRRMPEPPKVSPSDEEEEPEE